jgi:exosome complex component RRP43
MYLYLFRNIVSIAEPNILVEERTKFVWYLYIDIYCLNYDGNLLDASLIALLAALDDVKLPTVTLEDDKLVSNGILSKGGVSVLEYPIPLTFGMMDEYLLIDPTSEEEDLIASKFTVVYSNLNKLSHIIKPGGVSISEDQLRICIQKTRERMTEVLGVLSKVE